MRILIPVLSLAVLVAAVCAQDEPAEPVFKTSDQCMACHNGLRTPAGEDVSIGSNWSASMMANSARDPYWQAGVRREVTDHPFLSETIQDECATCHMPMSRTLARLSGDEGQVFDHLPVAREGGSRDRLAHDGVACSLCHQITDQKLGTSASFTGGYVVADRTRRVPRPMFGPFEIERGLSTIMRSSTGFQPTEALHVKQSELCATCHTLITKARGPKGEIIGELPEQVPFLEWKNSAYVSEERSCQSCHMPVVEQETPIASVLGAPRKGFSRHTFIGGNFFMLRMLDQYRAELGVRAPAEQMAAAIAATVSNLERATAELSVERADVSANTLLVDVVVRNLTGHKLPTGYPSRRVWLHLTVRDRTGKALFESGALQTNGSITGNDNDVNPLAAEPHHAQIQRTDQVQIYESVMSDSAGRPTTGLLSAVRYHKDNRLLPRGFDKATADASIAVSGDAATDPDFSEGGDRVHYQIDVARADGPWQVDVELRYQVIGFRWAENLRTYRSEETSRFVRYYESMASSSSEVLATASRRVSP
jgi:hypothetical protein